MPKHPDLAPEAKTRSSVLKMQGITKSFGTQKVLSNLDFELAEGQTTVVLGPSGCGKSVMLKHIIGLIRPDAGKIWFQDKRIDNLKERELKWVRLQIGLLFQLSALFDSMTVQQNLDLIARTPELLEIGRPVLSGLSRKSFVGRVSLERDSDPAERLAGTIALTALHRAVGALIFRVHDVAEALQAIRSADALASTARMTR